MAADDADEKKPEVDPWADILSESLDVSENLGSGAGLGEVDDASAFDFLDGDDDLVASDPAADALPAADLTAAEFAAADLAAAEFAADDLSAADLAADDLSADDLSAESFATESAADAPPLSVFAPEESAVGEPSPSTIEIGTGLSGIRLDEAEAAAEEAFAQAAAADEHDEATEPTHDFDFGSEPANDADETGFFAGVAEDESAAAADDTEAEGQDLFVAAAPAVAAAGTSPAVAGRVTPAKGAPKKKGGIGQMIGVVLGGLMSIPIVLGILIGLMWAGWPDTLGLRKSMPAALSFLLPPKQPSGLAKLTAVAPDAVADAGGSALDAALGGLAAADPANTDTDTAAPEGDDALGGDRPAPVDAFAAVGTLPGIDPLPADEPLVPAASDDPPSSDPDNTALAALGTRPAPLDDFDAAVLGGEPATARPEPASVEPEPLDMASLEAAVLAADEASAAVAALDDFADRGSRRQLIEWYRSLARVAAELAILERVAADSARPLTDVPDGVVDLHAKIVADGRLVEQLGRLAPMWLAFDKRDSDGVMLAGELSSTRPAGPWWRSQLIHPGADGTPRELTVITRAEPGAVAGEPVFVTGVIIGDDVVWGADCRAARASDSARPAADDIFGLPE
jgi:hypothetical protein